GQKPVTVSKREPRAPVGREGYHGTAGEAERPAFGADGDAAWAEQRAVVVAALLDDEAVAHDHQAARDAHPPLDAVADVRVVAKHAFDGEVAPTVIALDAFRIAGSVRRRDQGEQDAGSEGEPQTAAIELPHFDLEARVAVRAAGRALDAHFGARQGQPPDAGLGDARGAIERREAEPGSRPERVEVASRLLGARSR